MHPGSVSDPGQIRYSLLSLLPQHPAVFVGGKGEKELDIENWE